MRHLLAYGHRPGGSRLSASPRIVLSRFFSFVQQVHNGRQRRHGERTKAQDENKPPEAVPYSYRNYWTSQVAKWHYRTAVSPGFDSTWCRENISKFFASAIIDMWVPIVIYTHHVQHLPKLCPSFSLFFAHSTLCGHFENSISFWLCIIWRCIMHECWSAWC